MLVKQFCSVMVIGHHYFFHTAVFVDSSISNSCIFCSDCILQHGEGLDFFPLWKTSEIWYNEKVKKLGVEDEHSTITLCCGHCQ